MSVLFFVTKIQRNLVMHFLFVTGTTEINTIEVMIFSNLTDFYFVFIFDRQTGRPMLVFSRQMRQGDEAITYL